VGPRRSAYLFSIPSPAKSGDVWRSRAPAASFCFSIHIFSKVIPLLVLRISWSVQSPNHQVPNHTLMNPKVNVFVLSQIVGNPKSEIVKSAQNRTFCMSLGAQSVYCPCARLCFASVFCFRARTVQDVLRALFGARTRRILLFYTKSFSVYYLYFCLYFASISSFCI